MVLQMNSYQMILKNYGSFESNFLIQKLFAVIFVNFML